MAVNPIDIVHSLKERVEDILHNCTACGACADVCPTPAIDGFDASDSEQITQGILSLLKAGQGPDNAEAWAKGCCGSGFCQSVCEHGINPRFMLAMAKLKLAKRAAPQERKQKGKGSFKAMSRGVRLLSRLQLTPELMAKLSPSSHPERTTAPDIIFYTGCNMLKTPHIGLLCLDVLDHLNVSYEVHGGPANCCGILQLRTGDDENSARQGGKTIERFAKTGASEVLSWCPSCEIQFNETLLPSVVADKPKPFDVTMFSIFLARHLDRLKPLMTRAVPKRVALHEYPGSIGVTDSVIAVLSAIPGLELVDLGLSRAGYQLGTMTNSDYAKKHVAKLLRAGQEAEITTFAGIYHADHRELIRHEPYWPFEVVNYMDLIGESMGLSRPDLYKKFRLMQDADLIMSEAKEMVLANGLDPEDMRDQIINEMLVEEILEADPQKHPHGPA